MNKRVTLALATLAFASATLVTGADAKVRFFVGHFPYYETYYPGPEYIPPPRYYRYFDEPEVLPPDEFDSAYFGGDGFNEDYYEPRYEPQLRKRVDSPVKKKLRAATATSSKPAAKTSTPVKTAAVEPQPKSSTATGSSSNCDKAGKIVGSYGFENIKPTDCEGQVYAFNASRGGKNFAIKFSAASGELTEVKKLQ